MNFPTINEELCLTEADSGCLDPRCSDPAFALANPDICGAVQSLELKPGYALACAPSTLQFSTYLRSSLGEVPLTAGVLYSTSDASIVNIDASTGAATVLSAGVATITATWQGMNAFSQVNVVGGVNCCQSVQVRTVILLDSSNSMASAPTVNFPYKKSQAARSVALYAIEALNEAKDQMALVRFKDIAILKIGLTSVEADLLAALASTTAGAENGTNLKAALDEALLLFSQAPAPPPGTFVQPVILLIGDGANQPPMDSTAMAALMTEAQAFKDSGGIIVCIGIRAAGVGFTTLQNLSSGGFFLSCVVKMDVDNANARMKDLAAYYCGCSSPAIYGCYQYGSGSPPGPQVPDPNPPHDPEDGSSPPPPPPPPGQLPPVVMTPSVGPIGAGLNVLLSVPGHPNASIRFTLTTDGSGYAEDPGFAYPPSLLTGQDYDGMWVPIHLTASSPWTDNYMKAIAREPGFTDSVVTSNIFVTGQSNNTAAITINDTLISGQVAKATTYPSVKYVTGLTGLITKVTVQLKKFSHTSPDDVHVILRAPNGKTCCLMRNCGGQNSVSNLDFTFDDAAGGSLPDTTVMISGTFKPTQNGVEVQLPKPGPVQPYAATLANFNGGPPNGQWSLWIIDDTPLDSGSIAQGWDLTITSV